MTVLDDLADAVKAYATDQVATRIVDFAISSGNGTALNVGETFTFKVRVTNHGVLYMKDVRIRVLATEFADVRSQSSSTFGSGATASAFDLSSFNGDGTTGVFVGRAKKVTGTAAKDIVTAGIFSWDPDLNNLLRDNSKEGVQEGKLTKTIASD
jgi:hypothetical protein